MKRLVLALVLLFLFARPVLAQITSIGKAEADYRYQFDLYRTAYLKYQVDKSEYLKSGTLKAEQEALTSAKAASVARAEVLRTYSQWVRLQLLDYQTDYPRAGDLAGRLDIFNQWLVAHQTKISETTSKPTFYAVQQTYLDKIKERDRLFTQAQIELKLAKLTRYRLEMMRLYDPLKSILTPQRTIPEVAQGMDRADENFDTMDKQIKTISETVKILENPELRSASSDPETVSRSTSKTLEALRQVYLTTISILSELENRYGQR